MDYFYHMHIYVYHHMLKIFRFDKYMYFIWFQSRTYKQKWNYVVMLHFLYFNAIFFKMPINSHVHKKYKKITEWIKI